MTLIQKLEWKTDVSSTTDDDLHLSALTIACIPIDQSIDHILKEYHPLSTQNLLPDSSHDIISYF